MSKTVFISIKETSEYLGISRSRVYALVNGRREFPAVKMGKSWFINREKLPLWAEKVCK